MAGTFVRRVPIFNRTPNTLYVMFDGERNPIPSGLSDLPEHTIGKAKNQNPIMGSGDPYNPGASGTRYLIVTDDEEGWNVPLSPEEWEDHCNRPCREDETIWFRDHYGEDPKAKMVKRGSKNTVASRSRGEAGGAPTTLAQFTARD